MDGREWHDEDRVGRYLTTAPAIPWWEESERALVEHLPARVERFLDVGTGDGRLIALVRAARPDASAVGVDFSPPMLTAARARFADADDVAILAHDLSSPLPPLGDFDLVVTAYAIHHLDDARKRALYGELFALLRPGGLLLNLEHVASATPALHAEFLTAIGETPDDEDPSDRTVSAWTQAGWLAEAGFQDVDCHWKWRELALIGGRRPPAVRTRRPAP